MQFRKWFRATFKLPCVPTQHAAKGPARDAGRHEGAQAVWRPATPPLAPRIAMNFGDDDGGLDIWPLARASGSGGIRLPPTIYEVPSAQPSSLACHGNISRPFIETSPVAWPTRQAAAPKPAPRPQSRTAARAQWQQQQQHAHDGGHSSTPRPADKCEEPPLGEMSRESVFAIVNAVGKLIPHLPFAVCGHAAMVYYGHPAHRPSHVSIVCPERAAAILVGWARASGLRLSTHFPQAFYVATTARRDDDAETTAGVGCVRVLSCRDFDRLGRIRRGPSSTPVLTLPCIADRMAGRLYAAPGAGDAAQRAADIVWLLGRIVEDGGEEQLLTLDKAPVFGHAAFLAPFARQHPEAVALMREAGLKVGLLPGIQTREHAPPAAREPETSSLPTPRDRAEQHTGKSNTSGPVREPLRLQHTARQPRLQTATPSQHIQQQQQQEQQPSGGAPAKPATSKIHRCAARPQQQPPIPPRLSSVTASSRGDARHVRRKTQTRS
ncbi:hypothetical protein HRG_006398 [Hirsutella rhossiliensis]|uniref:Uncharacterized protein n=1 Tax=Hirsutella rhossiliensis TaxID=111463 RepID=A0A9P8SGY6_9HYPO|nr:uncharacterized protein HRG_06398 [Hirsutella rhossiliensis]KAH0962296.1 hypothetical protein HRG_06398 [Hirsutella rhossiliensis]